MKITKIECHVLVVPEYEPGAGSSALQLVDGKIPLPTAPGLGIQLNRDALNKYRVD